MLHSCPAGAIALASCAGSSVSAPVKACTENPVACGSSGEYVVSPHSQRRQQMPLHRLRAS